MTTPYYFMGAAGGYPYGDEFGFHPQHYPRLEDGSMIDPDLQSPSPIAPYTSQFAAPQVSPQVQEILNDRQRTAIFNVPTKMNHHFLTRPSVGIPPVPPPSHGRIGSPFSAIEPSSASGGTHSPPPDDSYFDHAASPANSQAFSPYAQQPTMDPWNSAPDASYINPIEAIPPHPQSDSFEIENQQTKGYNFLLRTSSWDSYSAADYYPARLASPDSVHHGAGEVQVANTALCPYPEVPQDTQEQEMGSDEELVPRPAPKRKSEADPAYQPPRINNNTRSPRKSQVKTRQAATSQAPAPAVAAAAAAPLSPPRKRAKTNNHQTKEPERYPPGPSPTVRRLPPSPSNAPKGAFLCLDPACEKNTSAGVGFNDQAALDQHIKKKHTRPYICVFHFAGCGSTFASKNEWKRHVSSQHLLLHYWICQEDECAKTCNFGTSPVPTNSLVRGGGHGAHTRVRGGHNRAPPTNKRGQQGLGLGQQQQPPAQPQKKLENGAIFNRKDLYTQHMRRMHMPEHIKKQLQLTSPSPSASSSNTSGNKKQQSAASNNAQSTPEWDETLRAFQDRALRSRCALPERMTCPAAKCEVEFHGVEAWDQRMEHVAKHLDRAAQQLEQPVVFGGLGDQCLTEWAGRADVNIIERCEEDDESWVLRGQGRHHQHMQGRHEGRGFRGGNGSGSGIVVMTTTPTVAVPAVVPQRPSRAAAAAAVKAVVASVVEEDEEEEEGDEIVVEGDGDDDEVDAEGEEDYDEV